MLSAGADTPLNARVDALGRDFSFDEAANTWTYAEVFEDWESIPVACQTGGYIKIDGEELPVVAANFGWQNMPLDVRQEKVIGDPRIEDVTINSRQFTYDITVKYKSPALYKKVLTGSTVGTQWSAKPLLHGSSSCLRQISQPLPCLTPCAYRAIRS
jgi:hypothetical protein